MKATATSESLGIARYETIQNNYSILNRRFEDELSNICRREKIGCLPYAPLGGGVCSGKYNVDEIPDDARYSAYLKMKGERQEEMAKRYVNEKSLETVVALRTLAQESNLELVPMCLAWSRQNDFVASTIFGATTMEQMEENLRAKDLIIPKDVLKKIDEITGSILYPMG
jgi:aryl-alcohol dehydrogenase-like predicted oxidoreductase